MKLSYVIITRNRREALLSTLAKLEQNTGLPRRSWETIVVDNASDDGSPEAVGKKFRSAKIIRLPENEGMPARNHGFKKARGRYVCMLDDDSYPEAGAIAKSIAHLERSPKTAAVVGRVVLPDGSLEGPAMPCVLLGGASVVRKTVLDQTGGFSPEFFRQAEEYDLSFRILRGGHAIDRFEDVVFRHEKVAGGRSSALVHRMDLRNNLILVERYLPKPLRRAYRHDWIRRYTALARGAGHADAAKTGMYEALVWARRERTVGRQTLDEMTVEAIFQLRAQADAVAAWRSGHGVKRVVVADFSKNLFATFRACREAGLEIMAVADDREAFAGMRYRGVPILNSADALARGADGVVVSNVNPAQMDARARQVRERFAGPVLTLWEPRYLEQPTGATTIAPTTPLPTTPLPNPNKPGTRAA
jgi:GT2 family glycosyltransferase